MRFFYLVEPECSAKFIFSDLHSTQYATPDFRRENVKMDNIDNTSHRDTSHRDGIVVIAITIELVVVTIAVALRVYTRKFIVKKLGRDDWAVVVSLVRCTSSHVRLENSR
jgi:hypothetical protein